VKADFRQLLIEEFGAELADLEFERRVPEVRGRLDALIGRTVFEAKSDLTREWDDVVRRMPDYLQGREEQERQKFVGIATDGLRWALFELSNRELIKIKETTLSVDQADQFLAWLDGGLALKSELAPTPLNIASELGQDSVAYRRASEALTHLWEQVRHDPAVALKRQLWSQLLKLVHGRDVESDPLWFQHTFLVIVAKAIAVAVMDLHEDDPRRLLSGRAFEAAGILGAVESDFFDWVLAAPAGEDLIRRMISHVRRFRLRDVQSDVLKVLYESLIDRDERHGLGEYYTPDWLAAKVVRDAVDRPLEQRVLDPACGSGTFLFHAVRAFLAEAEAAAVPGVSLAQEATAKVAGMDIHPVAIIIARVTYLLALAPALRQRTGAISIPVYLGDALQMSISNVMGMRELSVDVPPAADGAGATSLNFPDIICEDPELFDRAVEALRSGSEANLSREQVERRILRELETRYKREANEVERHAIRDLGATYVIFDELRRAGRDTVWAYVARNLSRPLAFSAGGGWAQVLIGNPPWVAFRHMSTDLKRRYKELARAERVYVGRVPSQNDLCAFFTARAAALYLRAGGKVAMVLPLAALTRGQYERFRTGSFASVKIAWDQAWTMDDTVMPLFPVPSCVLFGRRRAAGVRTPDVVRAYSGRLPFRDAPEAVADQNLQVREGVPAPEEAIAVGGSPYRKAFRNGATLFPRMLCFVERQPVGRLGGNQNAPLIISRRPAQEKKPWRDLPSIEGAVEAQFLRTILLGESIAPYRLFRPFEGVLPVTNGRRVLAAADAANLGFAGLHGWMSRAEELWEANRRSKLTLAEMFDYFAQLTSQFPLAPIRVVYSKAGTRPAAAVIRDPQAVIENTLYWKACADEREAHYLSAILNSETARARGEGLQARGQFGARHFDKVIWALPIPIFNPAVDLHLELARLGERAEAVAAGVEINGTGAFQTIRRSIRDALATDGVAGAVDDAVARLIG
jgi:SAM-dependent methyltransferase